MTFLTNQLNPRDLAKKQGIAVAQGDDDSELESSRVEAALEESEDQILNELKRILEALYAVIKRLKTTASSFFAGYFLIYVAGNVMPPLDEESQQLVLRTMVFLGLACFAMIPFRLAVEIVVYAFTKIRR